MAPNRRERNAFCKYWDEQVDWEGLTTEMEERASHAYISCYLPPPLKVDANGCRFGVMGIYHDVPFDKARADVAAARRDWITRNARAYGPALTEAGIGFDDIAEPIYDAPVLHFSRDQEVAHRESGGARQERRSMLDSWLDTLILNMAGIREYMADRLDAHLDPGARRMFSYTFCQHAARAFQGTRAYAAALAAGEVKKAAWPSTKRPDSYLWRHEARRSRRMAARSREVAAKTGAKDVLVVCGLGHAAQIAHLLMHPESNDIPLLYHLYGDDHPLRQRLNSGFPAAVDHE